MANTAAKLSLIDTLRIDLTLLLFYMGLHPFARNSHNIFNIRWMTCMLLLGSQVIEEKSFDFEAEACAICCPEIDIILVLFL